MISIIIKNLKKIKFFLGIKIKKIANWFINFISFDISFFILLIIFSCSISFFLGKISVVYKINQDQKNEAVLIQKKEAENIELVGSKKGKTYHFPWCAGALKMKEENKIFFSDRKDAEKKGYRAAKNCAGL